MINTYCKQDDIVHISVTNGRVTVMNRIINGGTCIFESNSISTQKTYSRAYSCENNLSPIYQNEIIVLLKASTDEWCRKLNTSVRINCDFTHSSISFDNMLTTVYRRIYTCLSICVKDRNNNSYTQVFPYILQIHEIHEQIERYFNRLSTSQDKEKISSGFYNIVFRAGWCGLIFHESCGHCLESDNLIRKASIFTKQDLGRKVSTPDLTLVDDPRSYYGGYLEIDDEGNIPKHTALIQFGYISSFLTDEFGSQVLGVDNIGRGRKEKYSSPTLPRMTNTYILPRDGYSEDSLLNEIYDGIYIQNLGGGSVNTSTGDFCFYATSANRIKKGVIENEVNDFMVIDNSLNFLGNVISIADNLKIESGYCKKEGQCVPISCGQPSIAIRNVFIR